MQTNDLQSNDMCTHLGTRKLSDQNKHILVIQKDFSMERKALFTRNAALDAMEQVSQYINGRTRSYGCDPLNKIEQKLQFLVMKKKNRKKVTRIETKFHTI